MLSVLLLLSKYRLRNVPVIKPGEPDIKNYITQSAVVHGLEGCKGRDWFDLIWYIQSGTPVNLSHLRARMRQTGHLSSKETFGERELHDLLHQRIDEIDWEMAKKDISPFISEKSKLAIWSSQFFHDLLFHLKCLDNS